MMMGILGSSCGCPNDEDIRRIFPRRREYLEGVDPPSPHSHIPIFREYERVLTDILTVIMGIRGGSGHPSENDGGMGGFLRTSQR